MEKARRKSPVGPRLKPVGVRFPPVTITRARERLLFFDAVTMFAKLAQRQSCLYLEICTGRSGTLWLLGHLVRQLRESELIAVLP